MNNIKIIFLFFIILSPIYATEYLITFKEKDTVPQFLNSLIKEGNQLHEYFSQRIKKTFRIGSLYGFHSNLTKELVRRIRKNPHISEVIPNLKINALFPIDQDEKNLEDLDDHEQGSSSFGMMVMQQGAPRHLARISSRTQLPFDFDNVTKYKTMFNYYYYLGNQGSNVRGYILDTGIDTTNSEFDNRIELGFDCTGEGPGDFNGHGTHVAGIVGSHTFGVAKNITLVDVKCLNGKGQGSLISVITALEWAVNDCNEHKEKKCVANLSLGSLKTHIMNKAIEEATKKGLIIVVAAGNYNMNACWVSPASSESAITVGAFDDRFDTIAKFSNWGPCVDIFAPGVSIASLVSKTGLTINRVIKNGTKEMDPQDINISRYVAYSGTSMASPSVCGIVALLLEEGIPEDKVKEELIKRSIKDVFNWRSLMFKPNTPNNVIHNGIEKEDDVFEDLTFSNIDEDILIKELNEYEAGKKNKKKEAIKVKDKDGKTRIVYLDNDLCLPNSEENNFFLIP
ncbi:hypothetical protein RI543_000925 [Arxiozyma heterogenica]|uniref:Peptidase S8/S53 domain-containing protein n=2 Tax=Arxiozyma heterogenica TaxID=278026 RepID=A0AAN7ZT64_9SACH|nr:hypothetical protein RI543_000925 [Kazachstania heterogenica]